MKTVTAQLFSVTPYIQSRFHGTEKDPRELADAYEKRTWKEKGHYSADGHVIIPCMSLKTALASAAKFKSEQIPGKGKATWTKHFLSGVRCMVNVELAATKGTIYGTTILCAVDGKKGSAGGKSVMRTFPTVESWEGVAEFLIQDDIITEDIFKSTLEDAGKFIGIGSFRSQNGGYCGCFRVGKISWRSGV